MCAHAQGNTLLSTEQISEYRRVKTFRIFEQEGRTAGAQGAVGDFCYFEFGVDLSLNAHQFTALFQRSNEISEVRVFH